MKEANLQKALNSNFRSFYNSVAEVAEEDGPSAACLFDCESGGQGGQEEG